MSDRPALLPSEKTIAPRTWFERLRDGICAAFEAIEDDYAGPLSMQAARPLRAHGLGAAGRRRRRRWRSMRGRVFEKVGVNISTVHGRVQRRVPRADPGRRTGGPHSGPAASRWSPICSSPLVPAVHMNTRHIVTAPGLVRRRRRPDADVTRDEAADTRRSTPR